MRRNKKRGSAAVEFALLSPFLFGLLIGVTVFGTKFVKELEITQVARDTAAMYSRGTDFSLSSNQQLVARLGQELGLQASGGSAVVVLSTVAFIGPSQCAAYPGRPCNNGKWVFTHRLTFGDTNLSGSNFGAPSCTLSSDGSVAPVDSVTSACALVTGFNALGTPADGADGFKPGQPAYLVEVRSRTGWGASDTAYAFALF